MCVILSHEGYKEFVIATGNLYVMSEVGIMRKNHAQKENEMPKEYRVISRQSGGHI